MDRAPGDLSRNPRRRGTMVPAPLAGTAFDRDALSRTADGALTGGADVRYLVTSGASIAVTEDADGIQPALLSEEPHPDRRDRPVLIGRRDGQRIIALDLPEPSAELDDPGFDLRELRRVATSLDHEDAGLALTAVAMGAWHRSMRHCPRCGAPLEAEEAGWVLRCTEEGTQNFPRTDPAVIMAVRDGRDRLLLARNARFRGTFHSVLAGFVEPGETLEAAVAREVAEEVGVLVEEVEYAGSQPWPFPRSLMLGFRAWARADQDAVLDLQDEEIAEAAWYTREEVTAALAEGRLSVPSTASIARGLIEDWYGGPLPAEH